MTYTKIKKFFVIIILVIFHGLLNSAIADSFFPGPLIKADWLSSHADDSLVILDTRKELDTFSSEGHIENAVPVDVGKIRVDRDIEGKKLTRMRPDAQGFQNFMRRQGIHNDSNIVITHQGKTSGQVAGAARLYWQMKFYGVKNVALLDGGNAAWVEALEDLSNESSGTDTKKNPGNYQVGPQHPEILATMQQVKDSLKNKSDILIDTRGLRYHIGIDKKNYVFGYGHIPGAKILPYKLLNPARGSAVYYPVSKLKEIINALGIDMKKPQILFCNSAYECSSVWFVLHEILGKTDVRIYDGSLHQWTQYQSNPMTKKLGE